MTLSPDTKLHMLRHAVATLAYRGGKTLRGAPAGFSAFSAAPGTRTPGQILAHLCDLFDWGVKMLDGVPEFRVSQPQSRLDSLQIGPRRCSRYRGVIGGNLRRKIDGAVCNSRCDSSQT